MTLPKLRRKQYGTLMHVRFIAYTSVFLMCLFMALYLHEAANQSNPSATIVLSDFKSKGKVDVPSINHLEPKSYGGMTEHDITHQNISEKDRVHEDDEDSLPKTITLHTSQGNINVKLRPDLSIASVRYIKALLEESSPCTNCNFYRAEKPGILQGHLSKKNIPPNTVLGDCPEEFKGLKHECPPHDPKCGCHGPVMTRGMIGWAAGKGGPEFFINSYIRKATWWNNDHTVWGEIADKDSMDVVMSFYDLPAHKRNLTFLDKPVAIELSTP